MAFQTEIWQCPQCGHRADISSLGFFAPVTCTHCSHTDYVHTLLANFRLEAIQGIGGMSVVLRGRDVLLNRPVAIKLLNETYRDQPERIARFENECSMMAKVHHPNVVSVYSAGWAKEQFYIAMELLEGKNLETIVTPQEPLKPLRAIDITTQIARGLEAAHIAGMLHRDMKPGNVIISSDGVAKVLDFGLAQAASAEDSEEVIWATPFYVAPETLQRNAEDARTDIYSLGMTLRYLLTGNDTLPGSPSSVSSLLEAKYHLAPFEKLMPGADETLCDLVNRMTAFAPEERHDNYADLLAELKEVHDALSEAHLGKHSPHRRRARMKQRFVYGASLATACLVSFFSAYFLSIPAAQRYVIPEIAEESFNMGAQGNPALAAAFAAMDKADWDLALQNLIALKENGQEPIVASWAMLHGAALSYLCCKSDNDVEACLESFRSSIAAVAEDSPATEMRHMLSQAAAALDSPEKIAEISDRRVLGLVHCLLVRHHLAQSKVGEAKEALASAAEEFRLSKSAPYATQLLSLVNGLEAGYAPAFAVATYNEALQLLAQHDFNEAQHRLAEQLKANPENAEELKVLAEVCTCGTTLCSTLSRVMKGKYEKGMSAERFLEINAQDKFIGEIRSKEFAALLMLLKQDYAAAFAANPYAADESSNDPFAIMMRDWKIRLAPYIKE